MAVALDFIPTVIGFCSSRCCYGLSNLSARGHVRDRRPRGDSLLMARQRRKAFCGLPTLAHADAHELSVTGSRTDETVMDRVITAEASGEVSNASVFAASRWPMSRRRVTRRCR